MASTLLASTLIGEVAELLTDVAKVHWTNTVLLSYLNDAIKEIVNKRPDTYTVTESFTLAAGCRQTLAADAIRLIDVLANHDGDAISKIDRHFIDTHIRGWRSEATGPAEHYIYDERDPRTFFLYPQPVAAQVATITVSKSPAAIVEGAAIPIDDIWSVAIKLYMQYMAWSKDSETAGNDAKAAGYLASFRQSIGDRTQADTSMAAKT